MSQVFNKDILLIMQDIKISEGLLSDNIEEIKDEESRISRLEEELKTCRSRVERYQASVNSREEGLGILRKKLCELLSIETVQPAPIHRSHTDNDPMDVLEARSAKD